MVSKLHWSAMSDTLRFACETDSRKCGHNAKHRSDLTACQYLAKHEQSPDLYCKRCARVAADMVPTESRPLAPTDVYGDQVSGSITIRENA